MENIICDKVYRIIPINSKTEIRVLVSMSKNKDSKKSLVDIRKFSLYGNNFDNVKHFTRKGIKFELKNIPEIIIGLLDIMVAHNMINKGCANDIKAILKNHKQ